MSNEKSMPIPRSKEAPRFKGDPKKLVDFLEDFETCALTAKLDSDGKCKQVVRYVSEEVRDLIETLDSFDNKDWKALKSELLKLYGSPDKKK